MLLARVAEDADHLHRATLLVREIEKRRPPAILLGDELLKHAPSLVVPRPVPPAKAIGARDRRRREEVGHRVLHARIGVHPAQDVRPSRSVARPAAERLLDEGERVAQGGQDRPREGPPGLAKTAARTESVGRVQREEAKGRERPIQQAAPIVPRATLSAAPPSSAPRPHLLFPSASSEGVPMSSSTDRIQKDDAASPPEHELGALRVTLHVRKSSRSSARHEGAGSDLGAQGSIDLREHLHGLPKIEEELRVPAGSAIGDEDSLRDLAARHSITARSNPPSLRDERPVRLRDAEANSINGRRVRVLLRHYATMVDLSNVAKMTPEQGTVNSEMPIRNPSLVPLKPETPWRLRDTRN